MFNELFWWYEMLMTRCWDAFEMLLFWDAFEMLIWDVLRWFEMLLTWVLLLHSWLCRIHCISRWSWCSLWWPVLVNIKMKAYVLLMPIFIGNYFKMGVLLQWYHMHLHYNWVTFDVAYWVVVKIDSLLLYVVDLLW